MSLLAHISDTHKNVDHIKATRIVTNYISETYGVSCPVLHSGDFGNGNENEDLYKLVNEEAQKYKNPFLGVLGNHDPENAPDYLSAIEFPDLVKYVDGKKIVCINKHWENSLQGINIHDQNNYGDLEERLDEIKKELKDADVIIMHEGAHDDLAVKKGNYNKKLGEIIKDRVGKGKKPLIMQAGHAHGTKYGKLEEGLFGIRPYGEEIKGAAYITAEVNGKRTTYKINNNKLYEWANKIDSSFEVGEIKKPNKEIPQIPQEELIWRSKKDPQHGPIDILIKNKASENLIKKYNLTEQVPSQEIQPGIEAYEFPQGFKEKFEEEESQTMNQNESNPEEAPQEGFEESMPEQPYSSQEREEEHLEKNQTAPEPMPMPPREEFQKAA